MKPGSSLTAFVQSLPKTETHLHLEGALPVELLKTVRPGVTVTLSTDDPVMFGNTVSEEYSALAERRGFTRRELVQLAKNGFRVALLPEGEKRRYCAELDAIEAGLSA
jgi:adenosine deaminase